MLRARIAPVLLAAAGSLLWASRASADAFSLYGFGPRGVASVGALGARAVDGTASYYNPGGLALGRGYHVEIGALYALSELQAQHHPIDFSDPAGATIAVDGDVPLTGPLSHVLRFGYGGYVLPDKLMHLGTPARSDPVYPYYENRSQRLVVLPALGVRLTRWLGIGAAANFFAGVSGPSELTHGPGGALEARIDQQAKSTVAAIVGLQARASDNLRLGLVYHQQFASPNLTRTESEVGGVPLVVNVDLEQAFFTPDTVVLAASSKPTRRMDLELDVAYERWSAYRGPSMKTDATLPGVSLRSRAAPRLWRDIFTLRAAASYRFDVGTRHNLLLNLGAGFEPSVQKSVQQGETNLLDGDKLLFGLGGTLVLHDVLPNTLRIGLGMQAQKVGSYSQNKRVCTVGGQCRADQVWGGDLNNPSANIDNPGYPAVEGSGSVWAFAASLGVDL